MENNVPSHSGHCLTFTLEVDHETGYNDIMSCFEIKFILIASTFHDIIVVCSYGIYMSE